MFLRLLYVSSYRIIYHGIEFFWNFNAWMDIGGGIQLEIPRDTTYQDMDTTAS